MQHPDLATFSRRALLHSDKWTPIIRVLQKALGVVIYLTLPLKKDMLDRHKITNSNIIIARQKVSQPYLQPGFATRKPALEANILQKKATLCAIGKHVMIVFPTVSYPK